MRKVEAASLVREDSSDSEGAGRHSSTLVGEGVTKDMSDFCSVEISTRKRFRLDDSLLDGNTTLAPSLVGSLGPSSDSSGAPSVVGSANPGQVSSLGLLQDDDWV